jgi:hypothetical protein
MANIFKSYLDNLGNGLVSGITRPKGNLGDWQHASRLYTDDNQAYAPKTKFLYHVVFDMYDGFDRAAPELSARHRNEINMLVKSVDLPSYAVDADVKNMYNRKKVVQTGISYDPVNITFHDDNYGVITKLMEAYYRYYYRDGSIVTPGVSPAYGARNTYSVDSFERYRYGLDTGIETPFFKQITIYQLARRKYFSYSLINPLVSGFSHDTLDQTDANGLMEHKMSLLYESVLYGTGDVSENTITGFGKAHYDQTPSPLTIKSGGNSNLFGQGGVLGGIGSVAGDIMSGNLSLGTALTAVNTYKNAKKMSKSAVAAELTGLATGALVGGIAAAAVYAFPSGAGGPPETATVSPTVDTADPAYAQKVASFQQMYDDFSED